MSNVQKGQIHQPTTVNLIGGAFQNGRQMSFNTVNDVLIATIWGEMTQFFQRFPFADLKCIGRQLQQLTLSPDKRRFSKWPTNATVAL